MRPRSIVFEDLCGVTWCIPWRVDEKTGRVTEFVRLVGGSEKIAHGNVNPEVEPKDKGTWVEDPYLPST